MELERIKAAGLAFTLVFICTSVSVMIGCTKNTQAQASRSPALDRIIDKGVLRVGYVPYPPSLIVDPNTNQFSGISHDVLSKVAENLGLRIEYVEEVGWGSMIEAVESGRVDIIGTAIWPTAARAKRAGFTVPFFYSTVKAYAGMNDSRFNNDLESTISKTTRIAVIDGEMAALIASADFPDAEQVAFTQLSDVSQLLLEVATGKADLTFVEPAVASQFLAKNPGRVAPVSGVAPVRVFPNTFLVKQDAVMLKNALDIAISEVLNSGYVTRVLKKYEQNPGEFALVAPPYREL